MRLTLLTLFAVILATYLLALFLRWPGEAPANGRPVALVDARMAPDWLRLLKPGKVARAPRCTTEASAYRWNGGALGAQRELPSGWTFWRGRRGYVGYAKRVFVNGTKRSVLVAAWCS